MNESEEPTDCAAREVCEEVGFDISEKIRDNRLIQKFINETMTRLYIITDVPIDFPFAPKTRNEIGWAFEFIHSEYLVIRGHIGQSRSLWKSSICIHLKFSFDTLWVEESKVRGVSDFGVPSAGTDYSLKFGDDGVQKLWIARFLNSSGVGYHLHANAKL